jgi:hypothetical protein
MVNMVQALNRDNFGGRQLVTCWTSPQSRQAVALTNFEILYGMPTLRTTTRCPRRDRERRNLT